MELPISIIVVLFIALIVGVLVVTFSQQTIGQAGTDLKGVTGGFSNNNANTNSPLIEVSSISPSQVAGLIDSCYSTSYGQSLGDRNCYIIHGTSSFDLGANSQTILSDLTQANASDVNIVPGSSNTVLINWVLSSSSVEVTT